MKPTQFLATAALVLLATAAARGQATPPPHSGNPDRGMAIFNAYCLACHGAEGKGDGPMAARLGTDFHVLPTDLSNPAWQRGLDDSALRKTIRGGGKAVHRSAFMPAWGMTLNTQQTDDLVAFVRDLKMTIPGQPPRVSVLNIQERLEHGRTIYNVYCASCHGRNGAGDGPLIEAADGVDALQRVPPNFNAKGFFSNKTDTELQKSAASAPGHAHMDLDVAKSAWWHQPFSEKERNSLVFFLRAQGLVSAPPDKVRRSAAKR